MRYGLAVLVIAFFAIVTTAVFVGRSDSGPGTSARVTKVTDYENKDSASVSWTQQGKLVGEDRRRAVRITITRSKRTVELLAGYPERVERSAEFTNSAEAFSAFTRALDTAGFGRERSVLQPDERGVCPQGNRFIYRLTEGNEEIMRTWSDSCRTSDGPFGGGNTAALIAKLFKEQITDYNDFVSGIRL